jgi:hypothetical protein
MPRADSNSIYGQNECSVPPSNPIVSPNAFPVNISVCCPHACLVLSTTTPRHLPRAMAVPIPPPPPPSTPPNAPTPPHPTTKGYEVDIYEARPFIGGKVASFQDKDGNHIEMGLHVFFGCYFNLFRCVCVVCVCVRERERMRVRLCMRICVCARVRACVRPGKRGWGVGG